MSVKNGMNFSIIISTFNRGWLIKKAVNSIYHQNYSLDKIELIIVDNNPISTNQSIIVSLRQAFSELKIKSILHNKKGISIASNAGIKAAFYNHIVLLDDDEIADRDLLLNYSNLWQKYSRDNVAMIGGQIKPIFDSGFNRKKYFAAKKTIGDWIFGVHTLGSKEKELSYSEVLYSGNVSINKKEVFETGYFDENLGVKKYFIHLYGHDVEFCWRLMKLNKRIVYSPDLVVFNLISKTRFNYIYYLKRYIAVGIALNYIDQKLFGLKMVSQKTYVYVNEIIQYITRLNFSKLGNLEVVYKLCYILSPHYKPE